MQIVKIFPNNKHKCHFSIRKLNGKFYVCEGDKVLRTELPSINSAETEISLIVLNRKNKDINEIPVKYGDITITHQIEKQMPEQKRERNHTLTPMKCATCEKDFMSKRSNHLTCSRECSVRFQARKKSLKRQNEQAQPTISKEETVETQNKSYNFDEWFGKFDQLDTFKMSSQDLNEFHELTEKQMRSSQRKQKVSQMASVFVDYVLTWCDVNRAFQHPQGYNSLFQEMVNYKIFDLSKSQLFRVFEPFFEVEFGTIHIKGNVNFFDLEKTVEVKEKLVNLIYQEDAIPNDEQIAKSSTLRLMLSQLNFIKKQQIDLSSMDFDKNINSVERKLDSDIIAGILDMINSIAKQNSIIGEKIEKCLEKQNSTIQLLIENTNDSSNDLTDLKICLEKLTKQVEEITKKRRGFFG